MATALGELHQGLDRFGLREFRPGQQDVVESVMSGSDCMCIMPTGGGKSLCYQLPSVLRDGTTLVVSPLIALMKDQVDSLGQLGIPATFINSSLEPAEQSARMDRMRAGEFKLVYIAPERFRSVRFNEVLHSINLQLFAVDEAHCISEWGHDFRPDYTRLGKVRERLGDPPTIALTATATPEVRADVAQQLRLRQPDTFVAGFARSNLWYQVKCISGRREKDRNLLEFLRQQTGAGIIYGSTRKACEEVAELIATETRRHVGVYHAGLESDQRRSVQDDFMSGKTEIVVATNAFGMGIDKSNVRFVVHYNITGTLEAYYQEAGRAGRDGDPSKCLLLYCPSDRRIQEFFIDNAYPSREIIKQVYQFLLQREEDPIELTQQDLKDALHLPVSTDGVGTCERLLEKTGVIKRMDPNRNMAAVTIDSELPTLVDLLPANSKVRRKVLGALEQLVGSRRGELVYFHPSQVARATSLPHNTVTRNLRELSQLEAIDYVAPFRGRAIHFTRRDLAFDDLKLDFDSLEDRRRSDMKKLDQVVRFAKSHGCRQAEILSYFGEQGSADCGHCDNCFDTVHSPVPSNPEISPSMNDSALSEAVKIVLSGIARGRGRFGKSVIAAMLCGSRSAKITRWKLDRLSTFGLLDCLTQSEVGQLIESMVSLRYAEQIEVDRFRPIVQLTEQGKEVMRDKAPSQSTLDIPRSVYAKLVARQVTRQVDSLVPTTEAPIPPQMLDTCTSDQEITTSPPNTDEESDEIRPSFYWTWRLFHDGYNAEESAAIRRLEHSEIVDHLTRAARTGWHVQTEWLLTNEQVRIIEELISTTANDQLHRIVPNLPTDLTIEHVLFFLESRGPSGSLAIRRT